MNINEQVIGNDTGGRNKAYFEVFSRHFYGWFGGYEDNP
jgi:hypothetical protein